MIDRLKQEAPKAIMICGQRYELQTHFRNCFLAACAIESEELTEWEKYEVLIENIYGIKYEDFEPSHVNEAIEKAIKFLTRGDTNQEPSNRKEFDLKFDSDLIYSAFLKAHINLDNEDNYHWWDFVAMLPELPESQLSTVVHLRQQKSRGKLTKEEREACNRIGWDVINMITPEQKEQSKQDAEAFGEYLGGAF